MTYGVWMALAEHVSCMTAWHLIHLTTTPAKIMDCGDLKIGHFYSHPNLKLK
jgi:hypothetical protein